MSKIVWMVEDNDETGGVRVVAEPSVESILLKHQRGGTLTSAEALVIHLARKSIEYSTKQGEMKSSIVIPTMS